MTPDAPRTPNDSSADLKRIVEMLQELQQNVERLKQELKNLEDRRAIQNVCRPYNTDDYNPLFPCAWRPDRKSLDIDEAKFLKEKIDYRRNFIIGCVASIVGAALGLVQYFGCLDIARVWTKK